MNWIQKILSLLLLTFPFSFTINLDKRQSTLTLPDCGQNCYTLALPDIGTCSEVNLFGYQEFFLFFS